MEQVRAVIVNPHIERRLTVQQVPAPSPLASEALVQVAAFSLSLGEVCRSLTADAGWRLGWDLDGRHSREWRAMA